MRRSRSTHQDVRTRRRQLVTYGLGFGAFVLFVNALVGDNGYLAALRSSRQQATLAETLQKVQLENARLQEQIRRMQEDPSALEEAARRDLNLIKPGETLIITRDKDAKPAPPPPAPPAGK
jgi:cell division protein FtsB